MIAAAAYQSGETLFSQYTGTWESGEHEERIVHKEILLPPNAPREYADRQTLWNAVDAAEKTQDAQTARRFIIALPKELTMEQNIELIRQYCQSTFVDKGMIADIAVHFNHENPPNPHAHVLLTMRSMDEHGKWQAKARSEYVLDENGDRIIGKNGKPKRIKIETVDWNDRGKCEEWRHEWEVQQNTVHDFSTKLNQASQSLEEKKAEVKTKEKRIKDIDGIINAVRTMSDLNPVLEKYNSIHFKYARERYFREHGKEIDQVKKAQWLLKKLKVELPIDEKALRREQKRLSGEVESLLPELEKMQSEMKRLSGIRSHIRKVMPDVLESRDKEGRRTNADCAEQESNQRYLDDLLQQTADQITAHGSANDAPVRQREVIIQKAQKKAQSHDEAR